MGEQAILDVLVVAGFASAPGLKDGWEAEDGRLFSYQLVF